jgi:hypothetical protein
MAGDIAMKTRTYVAALVSMMINAVVFGAGAIAVLSIPALEAEAWFWLPVVVVVSFLVSPFIGWALAPRLMARYERRRRTPPAMPERMAHF